MERGENNDAVLALAREELHIDRRVVDRGGARIHIKVEERDETVDALLTEQSVEIERVAINRVVETPPDTRQEGDVFVIPVVEEILVVERRLVLKEEIRVRRLDHQRPVRETARVRREVAELQQIPPTDPIEER